MTTASACVRCGAAVFAEDRFCGACGAPQTPAPTPYAPPVTTARADTTGYGARLLATLRSATMGEYEVRGEIGRGGMAAVYLAYDLRLNRKVAIKVMLPELAFHEGMEERFKREARTAAKLDHPNIVVIYSVRDDAELLFFVMKFIEGASLDKLIRGHAPLPVGIAQGILLQLANALQYAHDEGVVHRDVKPANVLVDRRGSALVTDFGIAKASEAPHLTRTGSVIGTPAYMSPEQCMGEEQSHASDQYSLGVVAYEMIAGRPPFIGPTVEVQWAHVKEAPPPLRSLRPDCPPALANAVMRMLAKEPSERWASLRDAMPAFATGLLPGDDSPRGGAAELVRRSMPAQPDPIAITPASPIPLRSSSARPTPPAPEALPASAPPASVRPASGPSASDPSASAPTAGALPSARATTPATGGRSVAPSESPAASADPVTPVAGLGVPSPPKVEHTPVVPPAGTRRRGPLVAAAVAGAVVLAAIAIVLTRGDGAAGDGAAAARASARPDTPTTGGPSPATPGPAVVDSPAAPRSAPPTPPPPASAVAEIPPATKAQPSGEPGADTIVAAFRITSPSPLMVEVGERRRITVRATNASGTVVASTRVRWQTSNATVASVTDDGTVVGLTEGTASVTIDVGGLTSRLPIDVRRPAPARVSAAIARDSLRVGDAARATARVSDRRGAALDARVLWRSSDPAVASVDEAGTVRAHRAGSITLSATAGLAADSVRVRVFAPAAAPVAAGGGGGAGRQDPPPTPAPRRAPAPDSTPAEPRAPSGGAVTGDVDALLVSATDAVIAAIGRGQVGPLTATPRFARFVRDNEPQLRSAPLLRGRTRSDAKIESVALIPLRWRTYAGREQAGSVEVLITLEPRNGVWAVTGLRNLNSP